MTTLAVDAGRTTFRSAVFSGGTRGASVQLDSGATLADPGGVSRLVDLLSAARRALGVDDEIDSVVIAAAGALFRPQQAEELARVLIAEGYPQVVVTTDIVAAHAGALGGRPGVVLAAGTGAVAVAIDAAGTATLVDGAGYLVGDAGSGFAVGRAGLAAALRHHDGRRGGSPALAALAAEQFGPLAELPGLLHAEAYPARAVAGFAPAVAAAARQGDPVAVGIWQAAVSDLADSAEAACLALPQRHRRIATTGTLFDLSDLVAEPFAALLATRLPDVPVRRAGGDALTGAARLAAGPATGYENLLLRWTSTRDAHRV